jgi:hypothetical protein
LTKNLATDEPRSSGEKNFHGTLRMAESRSQ